MPQRAAQMIIQEKEKIATPCFAGFAMTGFGWLLKPNFELADFLLLTMQIPTKQ